MAHQIHESNFVTYRQPAWHGLGVVIKEPVGALEAARCINIPDIHTEPCITFSGLDTGYKAIIGTLSTGEREVYSVVTDHYREITHQEFLEGWDASVKQHIESLGILMTGAGLFVSAKLPSFGVKGEEIDAYILAENWLTGTRTTKVRKTPVRVVCMNTLQMSDAASSMEIRLRHKGDIMTQLQSALSGIVEQSILEYHTLKETYEILASTPVGDPMAKNIFLQIYPERPIPTHLVLDAATNRTSLDRLAMWERVEVVQREHREGAFRLWAGEGQGSTSTAAAGTAWGAYNAVAEYEQYCKARRGAASMMFGAGRDRVAAAYDACLALIS